MAVAGAVAEAPVDATLAAPEDTASAPAVVESSEVVAEAVTVVVSAEEADKAWEVYTAQVRSFAHSMPLYH